MDPAAVGTKVASFVLSNGFTGFETLQDSYKDAKIGML